MQTAKAERAMPRPVEESPGQPEVATLPRRARFSLILELAALMGSILLVGRAFRDASPKDAWGWRPWLAWAWCVGGVGLSLYYLVQGQRVGRLRVGSVLVALAHLGLLSILAAASVIK